mmetsp:Transcript_29289/g.71411  ORF Transcript_29289/g.71411 Transcript_29289/m.71411 type:complete len:94 (+) Transcript_29289:1219-1500(+)
MPLEPHSFGFHSGLHFRDELRAALATTTKQKSPCCRMELTSMDIALRTFRGISISLRDKYVHFQCIHVKNKSTCCTIISSKLREEGIVVLPKS